MYYSIYMMADVRPQIPAVSWFTVDYPLLPLSIDRQFQTWSSVLKEETVHSTDTYTMKNSVRIACGHNTGAIAVRIRADTVWTQIRYRNFILTRTVYVQIWVQPCKCSL